MRIVEEVCSECQGSGMTYWGEWVCLSCDGTGEARS